MTPVSPDVARFVEQAGLVFEAAGMPRMAGRLLGYLMVCVPPRQSIAGLMQALKASNGSISTMTRFLESQGYVERISVQGDRKDYFALPSGVGVTVLTAAQTGIGKIRSLFSRALALNVDKGSTPRASVEEARDLFDFLAEEYPAMLARWRKRQRRPLKAVKRSRS